MGNKKITCKICGTEYEVCMFCPEVENFTPWRRICCSAEHYKLFVLISEYNGGILSKDEAYELLKTIKIDDTERKDFREEVKKALSEIEGAKIKKSSKTKIIEGAVTDKVTSDFEMEEEKENNDESF